MKWSDSKCFPMLSARDQVVSQNFALVLVSSINETKTTNLERCKIVLGTLEVHGTAKIIMNND